MKKSAIIALTLAAILTAAMFTGCTTKKDEGASSSGGVSSGAASSKAESSDLEDKIESGAESLASGMVATFHEAVKGVYGEAYLPSQPYDEAQLKEMFGIDPAWVKEVVAEGPMISTHVDQFVAVEAVDANAAAEVEKALNAHKGKLEEDSVQYPMNVPKVKSSVVKRSGNYVFFMLLGDPAVMDTAETEEDMLTAAQNEVKKAVDAIEKVITGK